MHNSELNKKQLSYRRDSARRRSLRRLRSFKVTDFGNNRKPVCDFLLVINTNSHARTISKLLQIIYQICAFNRGVLFFNTLVRVNPETYDHEIWPQETRNIVLSCCANCVSIS